MTMLFAQVQWMLENDLVGISRELSDFDQISASTNHEIVLAREMPIIQTDLISQKDSYF
ncbi:MAG: hypothetical protein HQK59_16905 [Deltaproteobacteria bacterium]|nr:hypothetical protein [Deltaproteobacteria bacterium]